MRSTTADNQKLIAAGYQVKQHTKYHWQVTKKGYTKVVDVWPTAQKYLIHFQPGPAGRYQDVVRAIDSCFAPYVPPPQRTLDPAQLAAKVEADALRAGGIQYIINKYGLQKD